MIILQAIILGIVQGVAEFLPISSSGHLVILHHFFVLPIANEMAFDVTLHLASLLAVILFFYKDISDIISSVFANLNKGWGQFSSLGWLLVFANIPAIIVGILFGDFIDNNVRSLSSVAFFLVVGGILFLLAEKYGKQEITIDKIGSKRAMLVGVLQPLALLPGISRSGVTVVAGLFSGLKRVDAIRFSFLLSIPVVLGAAVKESPVLWQANLDPANQLFLLIAFISAFVSALLTIKYLLKFAARFSLSVFAYYRFVLAALLLVYLLSR